MATTSTPALNISGKWLREAGFDTGTRVSAEISEGCIVLRVDKS
ncbi:SymE family type I addiction module toxin [Pantoea ananatis]